MKAMLYKDLRLMRSQLIMPLMVIWMIGMTIFFGGVQPISLGFTLGCTMLPFLTLSADENSQYLRFALSQPLSRRDYVWTKYLPNLLLLFLLMPLTLLIKPLIAGEAGPTLPLQIVLLMMMPGLMTTVLLPLVFRFGTNKTRLIYMGVIIASTFSLTTSTNILRFLADWGDQLSRFSPALLVLGGLALLILLLALSIRLSIGIVQKKDY